MALIDLNYEINSDNEINTIINELPLELAKEVIYNQIRNPEESNANNLSSLLYKIDLLIDEFSEDFESVSMLKKTALEFLLSILQRISSTYQLTLDVDEDNLGEIEEITKALYEVIVLRYKKNITLYLYNYIIKNLKTLAETYESSCKRKDFSVIFGDVMNNEIKREKVIVIYNLPLIFKSIYDLQDTADPIEFMEISGIDKLYYGDKLKSMIASGKIIGNFVPSYMNLLLDDYDEIKQDIFNDLRTKLILEIA